MGLLVPASSFDIRIDAQTHIRLTSPLAPDRPAQGGPGIALGLRPGQRIWCPQAWYGQDDQVPISLLALWDVGQKEPRYLASSLENPVHVETLYRRRMRLELANRDEKTGVLLRESGDSHAPSSLLHMHRLLLALAAAEWLWLCALTGLQARRDLPASSGALTYAAREPVSSLGARRRSALSLSWRTRSSKQGLAQFLRRACVPPLLNHHIPHSLDKSRRL